MYTNASRAEPNSGRKSTFLRRAPLAVLATAFSLALFGLMIEGMAQTAGVIGMLSTETDRPTAVYFLTIDKCKFRKPTGPGDIIEYHMRLVTRRRDMWWFHGDAKVNGEIVAEADVGAMLAD